LCELCVQARCQEKAGKEIEAKEVKVLNERIFSVQYDILPIIYIFRFSTYTTVTFFYFTIAI